MALGIKGLMLLCNLLNAHRFAPASARACSLSGPNRSWYYFKRGDIRSEFILYMNTSILYKYMLYICIFILDIL